MGKSLLTGEGLPTTTSQPVYERDPASLLGQRLVVTPWMLLDQLQVCREEAEALLELIQREEWGWERRYGIPVNPLAERAERVHFATGQLLRLLWRSGLWSEEPFEQAVDREGRPYFVLRTPFTDGKSQGLPLPSNSPEGMRELPGVEEPEAENAPEG